MAVASALSDEGTRTYQVTDTAGTFEITIPDTYKVTYGPFSPPRPRSDGLSGARSRFTPDTDPDGNIKPKGWVLRIYESDTKQRACFTDVLGFQDLSLPFRRTGADIDRQNS